MRQEGKPAVQEDDLCLEGTRHQWYLQGRQWRTSGLCYLWNPETLPSGCLQVGHKIWLHGETWYVCVCGSIPWIQEETEKERKAYTVISGSTRSSLTCWLQSHRPPRFHCRGLEGDSENQGRAQEKVRGDGEWRSRVMLNSQLASHAPLGWHGDFISKRPVDCGTQTMPSWTQVWGPHLAPLSKVESLHLELHLCCIACKDPTVPVQGRIRAQLKPKSEKKWAEIHGEQCLFLKSVFCPK
ncbi:serine protease-like protein 51 isoform X1 [Symphalangus syndactylus]|uniref:serine protease-like protein 51 isoform X1 n=1 Tax=Symphalangus syndactylus TaxID=9590 RepID=UPI0024431E8D|nr:serine protease-like protein 51 isoform X1 [Symphalangus syndactylus]